MPSRPSPPPRTFFFLKRNKTPIGNSVLLAAFSFRSNEYLDIFQGASQQKEEGEAAGCEGGGVIKVLLEKFNGKKREKQL